MKIPNEKLIDNGNAPFVIAALSSQINRFDCDLAHSAGWRAMRSDSIKLLKRLLAAFAQMRTSQITSLKVKGKINEIYMFCTDGDINRNARIC